jgi:hypothetical protein
MAIMVFVSQHEEISTRAPRFCVAYQAPHAVAADGTHAVAVDGSHAVTADRHAPRPLPVELDAEGQALRERLRAFRTQAVGKTTKFQHALPRLFRSPLEY